MTAKEPSYGSVTFGWCINHSINTVLMTVTHKTSDDGFGLDFQDQCQLYGFERIFREALDVIDAVITTHFNGQRQGVLPL